MVPSSAPPDLERAVQRRIHATFLVVRQDPDGLAGLSALAATEPGDATRWRF